MNTAPESYLAGATTAWQTSFCRMTINQFVKLLYMVLSQNKNERQFFALKYVSPVNFGQMPLGQMPLGELFCRCHNSLTNVVLPNDNESICKIIIHGPIPKQEWETIFLPEICFTSQFWPNAIGPNAIGPNVIGPNAIGPNAIRQFSALPFS